MNEISPRSGSEINSLSKEVSETFRNQEYWWYNKPEITEHVIGESTIEYYKGKVTKYKDTLEKTDKDIVCLDLRMSVYHMLQFFKHSTTSFNTGGFRAKILEVGKRGSLTIKKVKMTALLYGTFPTTRTDIIVFSNKGRAKTRPKKLIVGIANPLNHQGGMAFAIVRYVPHIFLPPPINDFGMLVLDVDIVGWGYVPSRSEVSTAVGTCLRKVAEDLTGARYIAIESRLVESRSLIPAPTTQADEVIIRPRSEKVIIHALVWGTPSFPLKEAELIQLG